MGEFEELMRLATQHTREVDKEVERKKKRQQLEEEKKRREQEKRREEEKATTAIQLAELRKRDLVLERERAERKREREREMERKKGLEEQAKGRDVRSGSITKEKARVHTLSEEIPRRKTYTSMSFDDLINQASDIPTSTFKLVPTSRTGSSINNSRSPAARRDATISGRAAKGTSSINPSVRDRNGSGERSVTRANGGIKSRDDNPHKRRQSGACELDSTRSASSSRGTSAKSISLKDVRRSASDLDVPSRKAKLSPGLKSSRSSEATRARRRSLSPPPKSRKRSISPRKSSSRRPVDDSEFNEDYVKNGNISSIIGQLFGYDRSRYANERYSDDDMEASMTDLRKEESRSAKIARLEDEREEELERQEQERLRARKKAKLEMEKKKSTR
ncbi:hypothetical protein K493DRAFT_312832 [Basidiobolus meristosporus CBS 931.73]|uniref:SPT2-domain-containing protein n=1 Tax=Basidiobolus meristosporus CBS 931.73 TaxID=1314790 RepID=A0A1Y1YR70_9FUNG|nr:hypothetical protein K493DRAFT_312832 [Basidiobolus meristosporus CBS 931.73]|eukprot:ORY00531.1 hypothetical protein K493DRAFT_312832 [Basidiobolus meristosporus CBS 931.73]